ncbi:hypothetical protein EKO27_g10055 [Xylaria grammica]|uniref:Uncharacterized protein n=1 Tax=Xylaria grammica TaxID=363999 RepID=A0A439CSD5_9PEZI|nr:hypothetical protein EKO27_g10055 [Xylaria grammica]
MRRFILNALYLGTALISTITRPYGLCTPAVRGIPQSPLSNTLAVSREPQSLQHTRYTRIRVHGVDDFKKLYPLILDYIREPELASSVKEFVFRSHLWELRYYCETDQTEVLRAQEDARDISQEHALFQLVTDLGIEESERPDWVKILSWMKPEFVAAQEEALAATNRSWEISRFYHRGNTVFAHHAAAILLLLCPNIEILKIEEGSVIVEDILRRNNYGLLPAAHLQKLRHVTLLPTSDPILGDERFYIHLDILGMLRLFHRLPAIESVSVDAVWTNYDAGYIEHFPPATSNLKKIHVEEFTFTAGGRATSDGGSAVMFANIIGKALHEHKSTLRKIDLDIDEHVDRYEDVYGYRHADDESGHWEGWVDEWFMRDAEISTGPWMVSELPSTRPYGATIGSMHDFESLTHLSIGIMALLGALPKSLEYLLIRGYERGKVKRYDDQIDEFLLVKQDRFPLLKEVHGINETIPIAASVEDPDGNDGQLWRPPNMDDEWAEEL